MLKEHFGRYMQFKLYSAISCNIALQCTWKTKQDIYLETSVKTVEHPQLQM